MAVEMMEYRPGKWVKVVDGKIVGRATAKEVAAWQASRGPEAKVPSGPLTLEVDLELPASSAAVDPARSLDVPLRPAFRRRGQKVKRPARKPEPAPTKERDDRIDDNMTVEMAIAREKAARRRKAPAKPKAEETADRVMVRRRLPTMEPAPAEKPHDEPATEDTPLPKQSKSPTKAAKPKTARRRRRKTAATAAPKKQTEKAPIAEPASEEPQDDAAVASQGPSYWWIYNANRQPVEAFLKEWMPKYEEKFGHKATVVLCHEDDYAEVEATGIEAEISPLLQPGHFYLAHQDGSESERGRKKGR